MYPRLTGNDLIDYLISISVDDDDVQFAKLISWDIYIMSIEPFKGIFKLSHLNKLST